MKTIPKRFLSFGSMVQWMIDTSNIDPLFKDKDRCELYIRSSSDGDGKWSNQDLHMVSFQFNIEIIQDSDDDYIF
jgi:hypothetical protein